MSLRRAIALVITGVLFPGCGRGTAGQPASVAAAHATSTGAPSTTTTTRSLYDPCTAADLAAPAHTTMPTAVRVGQDRNLGPSAEEPHATLAPARSTDEPAIGAADAWAKLRSTLGPSGGGTDELLLGRYSAPAPATPQPDGTLKPDDQDRLAWALFTHRLATIPPHHPSAPEIAGADPCWFLNTVSVIDANTGAPLASSGFRPNPPPAATTADPRTTHSPGGPNESPSTATTVPCPNGLTQPEIDANRSCVPEAPAGNGTGPDGTCTGTETDPPCGPGAEPGRYYPYTLPLRCDGLAIFDGRRWISMLPPPRNGGTMHVWMRLDPSSTVGFVSPNGAVGFNPDHGQTPQPCRG